MNLQTNILMWRILHDFTKHTLNSLHDHQHSAVSGWRRGSSHMPSKRAHQNKQNNTQLALSELHSSQNSARHADWIVTLAFYKALHAVDSYLAKFNIHPRDHYHRKKEVLQHLQQIHGQYSALYSASRNARYKKKTYQNRPQEVANLLNKSTQIENHINTLP